LSARAPPRRSLHAQPPKTQPAPNTKTQEQYRAAGEASRQDALEAAKRQLAAFRTKLEAFARDHRADIRRDPAFRAQFHAMCANVGVDPLASNKGAWAQLLGLGDFYYELGVAALEAAWASRPADGGLVPLAALTRAVARRRGSTADPVSEDDVARALKKLRALGPGVHVVELGGVAYVRSVPGELDPDRGAALGAAAAPAQRRACGAGTSGGSLTVSELVEVTGWTRPRAESALEGLLREGLAMADDLDFEEEEGGEDGGGSGAPRPAPGRRRRRRYWFPCLWDGVGGGAGGAGGTGAGMSSILPAPQAAAGS
jgi:ESCRT-II complex subunit VPS22